MSYLSEKISYLKGLAEGMKLDESTNEGKLLRAIIDALEDTADAIGEVVDIQDEMQLQLDDVDDDLAELEEIVYEEDDDDDWADDEDYYDPDFDEYTVRCPKCGEMICVDGDLLDDADDTITCPACGEKFDLFVDDEEEEE